MSLPVDPESNPQPPPPPLRLFNAFAKSPEGLEKCYYSVPTSIHEYFFRRLFASRRGIYQELISPYIAKLYDECQRRGLTGQQACWDKANEGIVAGILRDLNFDSVSHLTDLITVLQLELDACRAQLRLKVPVAKRSSPKRRSPSSSDGAEGQP